MNLLDSLLDAIVRLEGDALVMHVGEKPYVVTTSEATGQYRGPLAWGQVELSSRVLTLEAVVGMLGQILPIDHRAALDGFGATEYEVSAADNPAERFTIIAARGGDDIWLEVRRHRQRAAERAVTRPDEPASEAAAAPHAAARAPVASAAAQMVAPADQTPIEEAVEEVMPLDTAASEAMPAQEPVAVAPEPATTPAEAPTPVNESEVAAVEHALHIEEEPQDAFTPSVVLDDEVFVLDQDTIVAGAQIGSGQDWTDDVMTEGELGELLRASAAAIITGESDQHIHDFTAAEFDERPTVPEVPLAASSKDEPLVRAEETIETSLAAEDESGVARTMASDVLPVGNERQPAIAEKDPAVAAREALLAEQEELWGRLDAESAAASSEFRPTRASFEAPSFAVAAEARTPEAIVGGTEADVVELVTHEPGPTEPRIETIEHEPLVAAQEQPLSMAAYVKLVEPVAASTPEEMVEEDAPARPAAVVLPLTRPVRIEAAADPRGAAGTLDRVLNLAAARGAATVYLVAQSAPMVRVDGEFSPLEGEAAVNAALLERITAELAPRGRDGAGSAGSEWIIDVAEIGRVRCLSFRDHRGPGLIFRMVPSRAIAADQLGLPAEVQALCSEAEGLVLVAGGRGSGKSTLLTSFVDLINRTRSDHVIAIESQIEFVHENNRSFVSQREVRGDGDAMAAAVRAACREEPDVLVVEDLRTPELVSLALEAAESGRLVFGSVPAASAVAGLERIIEMFPPERREKVQASLAGALRGVVSQLLLRKLKGGRIAAREVLLNTPAVANLILEGKTFQLPAALENGRPSGMMPFAESLAALVRDGVVHPAHAYRRAPHRDQFLAILRRDGIDTSNAERLA